MRTNQKVTAFTRNIRIFFDEGSAKATNVAHRCVRFERNTRNEIELRVHNIEAETRLSAAVLRRRIIASL